jgi:oligopeptide transport system substrate-binding protein
VAVRGGRPPIILAILVASAALVVSTGLVASPSLVRASRDDVNILSGEPSTLDPAREGDAGSAAVTAQLYETLTAFDPGLNLRPALAASWNVLDDGRRVVFHLRPGLTFSDGSPLRAEDVVRSWLRIIDPAAPSPLASLAMDIEGAAAYADGRTSDPSTVGIAASGNDVIVRLVRPTDFPSVVASPTFGIVPPSVDASSSGAAPFVGSGAYRLDQRTSSALVLVANEHYWAGVPAIRTARLVFDIGGRSPVEAFSSGELDYAPIGDYDASWIAYDRDLGPRLVADPALATDYYGFDTSRPPFDDVRVRQAFARAVDWPRVVTLAVADGSVTPATSMVPPGIPGRGTGVFSPPHDPQEARRLLAAAGYPGGKGFPSIALTSGGTAYDEAVVAELKTVLGIDVRLEQMDSAQYFDRLAADPPPFWSLSWVADYPSPNDFLGILLGSGSSSNYSRWSSPEFDAAIDAAVSAPDPAAATAAYDRAQALVQRDIPVVPTSYTSGYALVREGLLGAGQNGLGILRLAGLAWGSP